MIKNPPKGDFPVKLKTEWEKIYDAVYEKYKNKERAARIAWFQIKKKWKKDLKTGKWKLIKKSKKIKT